MIVSFLRKLAAAGQAVLCTIHQPSASLFGRFDNLLLLKAGGNVSLLSLTLFTASWPLFLTEHSSIGYREHVIDTQTVYFGEIAKLSDYFGSNNVEFPKETNPAEFMIDVVSGDLSRDRDWGKVWLESEENKQMMQEIEKLNSEGSGGDGDDQAQAGEREDDKYEYASTTYMQLKLVTKRASIQVSGVLVFTLLACRHHCSTAVFTSFWTALGR